MDNLSVLKLYIFLFCIDKDKINILFNSFLLLIIKLDIKLLKYFLFLQPLDARLYGLIMDYMMEDGT